MTFSHRALRIGTAAALAAGITLVGSTGSGAQSIETAAPFAFDVYDSDEGSVPNLSDDGRQLYASFADRPMRVDLASGTSEVSGSFGEGVLSGQTSFIDDGLGDTFRASFRSGNSAPVARLPWAEPGASVLAADGFGRYVIPDAEPGTIHDTRTGLIWQPAPTFSRVRPTGPNSLSADGNTALFSEQCLRACPPGTIVYTRSTDTFRYLIGELTNSPEAAISANARYVGVPAPFGVIRFDLLTDEQENLFFDDVEPQPNGLANSIAVGNDGQMFWISGDHGYRWLAGATDIEQIDVSPTGESADAPIGSLQISHAGDRVVFTSAATNLDPSPGCCQPGNIQTYVGTAQAATGNVRAAASIDATGSHPKMADVSWDASPTTTVTGYALWRNGVEIAQALGTDIALTGLPSGNSYYQVQALAPSTGDDGGVRRSVKTAPTVVRIDYDATKPTVPTDLTAEYNPREGVFTLDWTESSDNSNVIRYAIYDRNVLVTMTSSFGRVTSRFRGAHYFQVRAFDLNGNQSVKTAPVRIDN